MNPAVPIAIASRADRPSGSGTTQPAGIRASSPKPPCRAVPMSYPWRAPARPARPPGRPRRHRAGEVDARDQRVGPGDLAVGSRREPVLEVHAGPLDRDGHLARGQVPGRERAEAAVNAPSAGLSTT